MLIGLSGAVEAGKDETAKVLVERANFRRLALATKMKEAALALDPIVDFAPIGPAPTKPSQMQAWHPIRLSELIAEVGPEKAKKHPEVRRTYQRLATEVGRNIIDEDIWVKILFDIMKDARGHKNPDWVISDVRFLNELRAIQRKGGYVIRIIRPGHVGLTGEEAKHVSEHQLGDEDGLYDAILYNDGTLDELPAKVVKALVELGKV